MVLLKIIQRGTTTRLSLATLKPFNGVLESDAMLFDARTWHLLPFCHAPIKLLDEIVDNLAAAVVVVIQLRINPFLST